MEYVYPRLFAFCFVPPFAVHAVVGGCFSFAVLYVSFFHLLLSQPDFNYHNNIRSLLTKATENQEIPNSKCLPR